MTEQPQPILKEIGICRDCGADVPYEYWVGHRKLCSYCIRGIIPRMPQPTPQPKPEDKS